MVTVINSELEKVNQWTIANRLTINTNKTELIIFTNKTNYSNENDKIYLNGQIIDPVDHVRFLGVMIDKNLNFKMHIQHVLDKISKHAGILYKIKNQLPISARITYYNSFVLPYLTYNIVHWGNTNSVHLNCLVTMQKRIIRTISNAEFLAHTSPIFYRLGILKLEDLYNYLIVIDTFKKFHTGIYSVTHSLDTRNRNRAQPKFHSLSRCQQSITYNGPIQWNLLPDDLRKIDSLPLFKSKLKRYYIEKYAILPAS